MRVTPAGVTLVVVGEPTMELVYEMQHYYVKTVFPSIMRKSVPAERMLASRSQRLEREIY